jgi:hypothetical protein
VEAGSCVVIIALIIVPDGETRFALLTLLTVWCKLAVTDKTLCDVFGFFMSAIYIDCYRYISSKFTPSGMIWAELGEVQGRIADPDDVG